MQAQPIIKICGIRDAVTLRAVDALLGAGDYIGIVHYPPSVRHVGLADLQVLGDVTTRASKVLLTVDADDEVLETAVQALRPNLLQCHGQEDTARCRALRDQYGLPLIKAISVKDVRDLERVHQYSHMVDYMLLDAPSIGGITGGTGVTFDWSLLKDFVALKPWFLAGGLTPHNVKEAIAMLSPYAVDVSSGVERIRGQKDMYLVKDFIGAVRGD
jgi:phosphoribosylanthranilate isomerase